MVYNQTMKLLKIIILLIILIVSGAGIFLLIKSKTKPTDQKEASPTSEIANPASVYCEENGGKVKIITSDTGDQMGICIFENGSSCEEWAYYRKECQKDDGKSDQTYDVSKEFAEIKAAAEAELKIDTTLMEVKVRKSTGKYASGSVSPIEEGIGGGYLYMAKIDGVWKVVADGNGQISCAQLEPYPDFPVDMIPECVNADGNPITR
jgi:putative hemolysin